MTRSVGLKKIYNKKCWIVFLNAVFGTGGTAVARVAAPFPLHHVRVDQFTEPTKQIGYRGWKRDEEIRARKERGIEKEIDKERREWQISNGEEHRTLPDPIKQTWLHLVPLSKLLYMHTIIHQQLIGNRLYPSIFCVGVQPVLRFRLGPTFFSLGYGSIFWNWSDPIVNERSIY